MTTTPQKIPGRLALDLGFGVIRMNPVRLYYSIKETILSFSFYFFNPLSLPERLT